MSNRPRSPVRLLINCKESFPGWYAVTSGAALTARDGTWGQERGGAPGMPISDTNISRDFKRNQCKTPFFRVFDMVYCCAELNHSAVLTGRI